VSDRETREAAWTILRDRKGMVGAGHRAAVEWASAYVDSGRGPLAYGVIVTLSVAQMAEVRAWTVEVMADNAKHRGRGMKHEPPRGETEFDVKLRGFAAELAVATETGLAWNRELLSEHYRLGHRHKHPDVGANVEVRNHRRPDGQLAVYDNDPPQRIVTSVTGVGPTFVIRGWIRARDARVGPGEHVRDGLRWYVDQATLHPLPLPEDA